MVIIHQRLKKLRLPSSRDEDPVFCKKLNTRVEKCGLGLVLTNIASSALTAKMFVFFAMKRERGGIDKEKERRERERETER